jgi:hypothetical protein
MINRNALTAILMAMFLALNISGCSTETLDMPSSSGEKEVGAVSTEESGEREVPVNKKATVKIIPENPTVGVQLQAITTGGQNVNYRWERNDDEIVGIDTNVLKDGFLEGDMVSVRVFTENSEATASVVISNAVPIITDVTITPEYIYSGTDIHIEVRVEDPDHDETTLTYKWFVNDGEILYEKEPVLKSDKFERGDNVSFQVIPSDGKDDGNVFNSALMTIPNGVPIFLSSPPLIFKSHTYNYKVRVEDPDGDHLEFRLSEAPDGMVIDPETGEIMWNITGSGEGEHTVEIVAEDDFGGEGFQKYALTITVQEG